MTSSLSSLARIPKLRLMVSVDGPNDRLADRRSLVTMEPRPDGRCPRGHGPITSRRLIIGAYYLRRRRAAFQGLKRLLEAKAR